MSRSLAVISAVSLGVAFIIFAPGGLLPSSKSGGVRFQIPGPTSDPTTAPRSAESDDVR